MKKNLAGLSLAATLLAAPAFAADPASPTTKPETTTRPEIINRPEATKAAAPTGPTLTDPQIATVALTAHQVDAENGKLAAKKTKSPEVKQFAEAMVKDHEAGAKEVTDLAKKLGVKTEESPISQDLKKSGKETAERLKKLSGTEFDRAYISAEISVHEQVINTVEKVLIPNAKNAELKAALEHTLPTLQGHLQHAKNVQNRLATGGSGY